MITIGILGLQGAIVEHEKAILNAATQLNLDIKLKRITNPEDIDGIAGIIMPGGESTAMVLIGSKNGMLNAVLDALSRGLPAFGTCAGAILLSKSVRRDGNDTEKQGAFPFLDISILRNGYGRQRNSFTTDLTINKFEDVFKGIFIRAPVINSIGNDVEVLAEFNGKPILVKQENIIVSTFHPELTVDTRIHEQFLKLIENRS